MKLEQRTLPFYAPAIFLFGIIFLAASFRAVFLQAQESQEDDEVHYAEYLQQSRTQNLLSEPALSPASSAERITWSRSMQPNHRYNADGYFFYERWDNVEQTEGVPENQGIGFDYGAVKLVIYGNTNINATYGATAYRSEKDRTDDYSIAKSSGIRRGFQVQMPMQVNVKGKIGKRITVDIDYDRNEKQTENTVQVQYKAIRRREFVREVTIGNIDLSIPESEFAVFQKNSKKTIGLDSKMQRGKLSFHGIATLTRGESETETFTGMTKRTTSHVQEYRYTPRKYYQLEPFLYYGDGCLPSVSSASYNRTSPSALRTLSSRYSGSVPLTGTAVSIVDGSLEIYLDDRNARNDDTNGAKVLSQISARTLSDSLGKYHKMTSGKDYVFYPESGRIVFPSFLSPEDRVFVRYTRTSSASTCDTTAWQDGSGIIETFLKWDSSLQEDILRNGISTGNDDITVIDDASPNLDIYEIRGIYETDDSQIDEADFQMSLLDRAYNQAAGLSSLGTYSIDYETGRIFFFLREPFLNVTDTNGAFYISDSARYNLYSDKPPAGAADFTALQLRLEYTQKVQSYRLRHPNILRGSVRVRVDNEPVDSSLYYVDYYSGYFTFINPDKPLVGNGTKVEISYEYSPYGISGQGYIGGLRTEYKASRELTLGSTLLYNGQFSPFSAPRPGEEPASQLVTEADMHLHYGEDKMSALAGMLSLGEIEHLAVDVDTYAEAARSIHNQNTYGVALVDDFESSEDSIEAPISERDWILSSPPLNQATTAPYDACSRAPLLYKYYRDPADPRIGLLSLSSVPKASPSYAAMPGPYNVAEGHLDSSQLKTDQAEKQVSLVLDYDFDSAGAEPFAAIATRTFGSAARDFSQVAYVEFNAKLTDATAAQIINIFLETGTISEDSDGDGILDTEDLGFNHVADGASDPHEGDYLLSTERDSGKTEDIGYLFNPPSCTVTTTVGAGPSISGYPATDGNGVLNTEDTIRDGILSTGENTVRIPDGTTAFIADHSGDNTISPGEWKHFRFLIDRNKLTNSQKQALSSVYSLRLFITPDSGSGKGKLLIDGIKFGSPRWRSARAITPSGDSAEITDPEYFSALIMDNFNSRDEYYSEAFIKQKRDDYEKLHGKYTNTEYDRLREATLKVTYDFQSSFTRYFISRVFPDPMNLEQYGKMHIWSRTRSHSGSEKVFLRIGSDESNYFEFETSLPGNSWTNLSFDLKRPGAAVGRPNLQEISLVQIGMGDDTTLGSGEIWFNDITVSDVSLLTDDAWLFRSTVKITEPLYTTKSGTPILSDIVLHYQQKHRGKDFSGIGTSRYHYSEDHSFFTAGTNITPWWKSAYSFNALYTMADPESILVSSDKRGSRTELNHSVKNDFQFEQTGIPDVSTQYNYQSISRNYRDFLKTGIEDSDRLETIEEQKIHSPSVALKEEKKIIGNAKLIYQFRSSLRYFHKRMESVNIDDSNSLVSSDSEKEQSEDSENSLTLENSFFSMTPSIRHSRKMLLEKKLTDSNILQPLHGEFTLPYTRPGNFRYRQRITDASLKNSLRFKALSMETEASILYQENSFRDNPISFEEESYQRLKQPSTQTLISLSIPVKPPAIHNMLKFFSSFVPRFEREITLAENSLPYTRGRELLEDELGFRRVVPPLSVRSMDLFSYPFWYGFVSQNRKENNFSNAREYVRTTKYRPVLPADSEALLLEYSNSLSQRDSVAFPSKFQLPKEIFIITDFRLAQEARRSSLTALPQQQVLLAYTVRETMDLMKLIDMPFLENLGGRSFTSELRYTFDRKMRITENLREDAHTPGLTLTFTWNTKKSERRTLSLLLNYRLSQYTEEEYLSPDGPEADKILYQAIPERGALIGKTEHGAQTALEYTTEMESLRVYLAELTKLNLTYKPRYSAKISADLNRIEYGRDETITTPTTLDRYAVNQTLDINLHQNVTGNFNVLTLWDIHRDVHTKNTEQEILGLEIGLGARILF